MKNQCTVFLNFISSMLLEWFSLFFVVLREEMAEYLYGKIITQADKILLKSYSLSGSPWNAGEKISGGEKRRQNVKCCLLWHGTPHKVACARWKRRQNRSGRARTEGKKVRVIKESVCVMYSAGKGPAWWMAARLCVIDAAFCAAGKEEKKRCGAGGGAGQRKTGGWRALAGRTPRSLNRLLAQKTRAGSRKKANTPLRKQTQKQSQLNPFNGTRIQATPSLLLLALSKLWTSSREPSYTIHFGTKCAAMALSKRTKSRFQGSWIFDHSFSSYWNFHVGKCCRWEFMTRQRVNCCVHWNLLLCMTKFKSLAGAKLCIAFWKNSTPKISEQQK